MPSPIKHLLLGAAALTLAAAAAHASTITQTVNFGPGLTDYSSSPGTPAVFTYFDSNLGTLNAVSFSSSYQISSQITVLSASSASTGTVRTQSAAQFGSTSSAVAGVLNKAVNNTVDPVDGTSVMVGASTLSPIAYDLRGNTSIYNLAPGAANTFTSAASGSKALFTDTSASDLSAFFRPGGGTYSILLNTLTGLILSSSGGNAFGSQATTASASLTVNYTYTAAAAPVAVTPEPSSLVLLGTGLLGVVGAAKRRYV